MQGYTYSFFVLKVIMLMGIYCIMGRDGSDSGVIY